MSTVKQSHNPEQHFFFAQQRTVDLTQQERQALSSVWLRDSDNQSINRRDTDTAHCAVLGYN